MGGGGSSSPAAVAPTVNTATVQHSNTGAGHVGGTTGGKGGGNPFGAPQQPQQIQFGGYGQQSPFGLTNPQTWGGTQAGGGWGTGGVQNTTNRGPVQNTFNPTAFTQSQNSLQASQDPSQQVPADNGNQGTFDINQQRNVPEGGVVDTGAGLYSDVQRGIQGWGTHTDPNAGFVERQFGSGPIENPQGSDVLAGEGIGNVGNFMLDVSGNRGLTRDQAQVRNMTGVTVPQEQLQNQSARERDDFIASTSGYGSTYDYHEALQSGQHGQLRAQQQAAAYREAQNNDNDSGGGDDSGGSSGGKS